MSLVEAMSGSIAGTNDAFDSNRNVRPYGPARESAAFIELVQSAGSHS